jgi:hypothetical protein
MKLGYRVAHFGPSIHTVPVVLISGHVSHHFAVNAISGYVIFGGDL